MTKPAPPAPVVKEEPKPEPEASKATAESFEQPASEMANKEEVHSDDYDELSWNRNDFRSPGDEQGVDSDHEPLTIKEDG